jgi:hypothetical protein
MKNILSCAAAVVMIALAYRADGADQDTAAKQDSPAKKGAPKSASPSPAKKSGASTRNAASRGKKGPAKKATTWRNRQLSPTPDRYRQIQSALATKGYLKPEDATGTWNQGSVDALKKFQAEQNLESSGKINSLSLIALGLGPHRDPAPPPPNKIPPPPGQ